jgi:hypothetical protein
MSDNRSSAEKLRANALLALEGLSDTPERDLADFLAAAGDAILLKIADALRGGKTAVIKLNASEQSASQVNVIARQKRVRSRWLADGQMALKLGSVGVARHEIEREMSRGEDYLKKAKSFARRCESFVERQLQKWPESLSKNNQRFILEDWFCYLECPARPKSRQDISNLGNS